jgi:hypothetical protein
VALIILSAALLFNHVIFESDALRVVLLKPPFGGI